MRPITVVTLVLLLPTICPAQSPQLDRLSRLEILADVWSKAYVYHPRVASGDVDYNQALLDAIPLAERATSDGDFVRVIRERLFAPLNDFQTSIQLATAERCGARPAGPPSNVQATLLAQGVGLVRIPDPRLEADRQNPFLDRFKAPVDALGHIDTLIVDLRYQVDAAAEAWTSYWLGLLTDTPLPQAHYLRRIHEGLNEFNSSNNAYRQRWQVDGGDQLARAFWNGVTRPTISTPVLFVVNHASYPPFARTLDALQRAGRAAVLWEDSGCVVGPDVEEYGGNIRVYVNFLQLLGREGGARPDRTSTTHIADDRLLQIARELLAGLSPRKPSAIEIPPLRLRPFDRPVDTLTDRTHRVFWVMKVWMAIRYYFPHLEYASINWNKALRDWIPRVEAAATADEFFDILQRMTAPLNDSHIRVVAPSSPANLLFYPAVRLARIEGKVIVTATGDEARKEVMPGDEVVAIGGEMLDSIEARMRAHISASTEGAFYRAWNRQTAGGRDTKVTLTLNRSGTLKTVNLKRTLPLPFTPLSVPTPPGVTPQSVPAPSPDIAYINMVGLRSLTEFEAEFNKARSSRGLVLDLRGFTPYGSARRFLAQRLYDHPVKLQIAEIPLVHRHSWGPSTTYMELVEYAQPFAAGWYPGPVVVLINADAQSTPESTCLDISTNHRVTFVGSPTTGTTGGTTTFGLPGGWRLEFTGTRVRYPDGRRFQNVGIVPDVHVEPTQRGIAAGRDEVLEKGVEVLRSKLQ
jgi:hypothetical protein